MNKKVIVIPIESEENLEISAQEDFINIPTIQSLEDFILLVFIIIDD